MRGQKMKFFGVVVAMMTLLASSPAWADVTVTGTVGEIGILPVTCVGNQGCNFGQAVLFRFNLTDATQTATCTDQTWSKTGQTTKYAYFLGPQNSQGNPVDIQYHEWYAALLVSKKGSTLTCTISDNNNCRVTSCTLP